MQREWIRRKKPLGWILLALVALGGIGLLLRGKRAPSAKYDTSAVKRGTLVAKVTASGSLSALVTVQVGSQVSGRISKLNVDFNSVVKKGDVLAQIDPQLFNAALAQAEANDKAARANLVKARVKAADLRRQADRAKALLERKLIAQADYDSAEANAQAGESDIDVARGSLEQSRAAMQQARVNLDYTTIVSPIDGIVISRSVDVGQTVAASLQAPTLFAIAEDLKKMQVDISVAEADVGRLRPEMEVLFTVDAFSGERFRAVIRQIRNAPQTVQNVVTYDAVADVDNAMGKLRPGMTATCSIVYDERKGVLQIPTIALRFRPPPDLGQAPRQDSRSGERTVWVLRGDRPSPTAVKLGLSDGTYAEVLSGDLQEGDRIVTDVIGGGSGTPPGMRRIL